MIEKITLNSVMERLGTDPSKTNSLGGFDNSVYEVHINNHPYVLKFYRAENREKSLIQGELDWIIHLGKKGVAVARPFTFNKMSLIQQIQGEGGKFYYVLFEKVSGEFINIENPDHTLVENWGEVMGKIHRLAKSYSPPPKGRIMKWYENNIVTAPPELAPDTVLRKWEDALQKLKGCPPSTEKYGIIHNDLHHQNLYFRQGKPLIFDFGDCEYGWFAYDIGISLYHGIQAVRDNVGNPFDYANQFLNVFLRGYLRENPSYEFCKKEIEFFLDFRRMYSYLYLLKNIPRDQINESLQRVLQGMEREIKEGISIIKRSL